MGLGIKSLQKKNGKLEQCECKAIPNGSTGDGRAPYLEKLYIFYTSYVVLFVFFCFFVVFCVFSCFFFGDSIQNSEYSFFSVLPLARLTQLFWTWKAHQNPYGAPLCTPFNRYVTTLTTYSLHIPPLPDANMKYWCAIWDCLKCFGASDVGRYKWYTIYSYID